MSKPKVYKPKYVYYVCLWDPIRDDNIGVNPEFELNVVCNSYEDAVEFMSTIGIDYKSSSMKRCNHVRTFKNVEPS